MSGYPANQDLSWVVERGGTIDCMLVLSRDAVTYLTYACLLSPLPLLAIAWSRSNRLPVQFSILTLSAVLYDSAAIRSLKLTLLGSDYSHRLFTTIVGVEKRADRPEF